MRSKCALSKLKQIVFAYNTTKMLISDDFGVVYRIIDTRAPEQKHLDLGASFR